MQIVEHGTRWLYVISMVFYLCSLALVRAHPSGEREPAIYAGGVAGIADLLNPSNSQIYRAKGGGLYLHNSGWGELTTDQQSRILQVFRGDPIAVELGFGSGAAWGDIYRTRYLAFGIHPVFIASNAFSQNNHPTPEQWSKYSAGLRDHGVPASTLILPTFEYQNFKANIDTLSQNEISLSSEFQAIARTAGGVVLDTPSGYSMAREPAYRDWIVDAIRWTAQHGLKSVVILSPGSSGKNWGRDTERYARYLSGHDAMPSAFVCENYAGSTSPNYPNRVGSESYSYTALGNCLMLKQTILPNLGENASHTENLTVPKRWIVERTISWLDRRRRLAKD